MTEAEARDYFRKLSTPPLDKLRSEALTMRTSDLIGFLIEKETLVDKVTDDEMPRDEAQALAMAAALVILDEIDRRVPVPA